MSSSPLILNCPLCCDETFTSHSSLKYHLLSIIDNIICPACNKRFDKLMELVVHLENECAEEEEEEEQIFEEDPYLKVEGNEDYVETTIEEDLDEEASNNDNVSENADEENTQYFCQVCSVYFEDIEQHLQEFHEGQELMLESENENVAADEDEVFEESEKSFRIDTPQIISTEEADSVEPNETSTEKDILDRHGHTYMRKLMKTGDRDEIKKNKKKPPIIENYISINGETILIAREDVKNPADLVIIYKCPSCSAESSSVMDYVKHDCDPKTASHDCDICGAIFLTNKALSNHKRKHYRVKKKVEVATHKTEENMVCDVCGTEFPSFKSLLLHKRMHNPIKSQTLVAAPVSYGPAETTKSKSSETFECTICDKSYNINYKEVHMKSHKEGDTFICPVCNKKFFTKLNLAMHSKAHNSDKKFCCSYCKKAFLTQDSMNEHVLTQCQMKKYECKFCGRRFGKPHEKVKHERIHTGSKPYVCDICGKAFRVSYCLTLHTRTHTGLRPYQCQHCGKRFKSHSVYNHHLLTHSEVRAYKCPFCPKAFKTNVQLAGHKNSHTKPFSCTECNRPFASLYAVRGHMETHKRLNNLKYDCSVCGAIYARLFALKDHMKAQHGKDLVSDTGELVDRRQVDTKKKASILKTDARKAIK